MLAIGLLVIFSALGTAYLTRMVVESEYSALEVREARARNLATAGASAAIGALQASLQDGTTADVTGTRTISFPTYETIREADGLQLQTLDGRKAEATVTVSDESGKVNLNHAPPSVLQRVLGVDGATARGITGSLPRPGESAEEAAKEDRRWLISVRDLLDRGLVTEEQYAAIDQDLVTTWTVADHDAAAGFLNINTAPVPVLAALLDLSQEAAQQVAEKRPFASLKEIATAAEKPAFTFNVKPEATQPAVLPAPLSLSSRCFRIQSAGVYATGQQGTPETKRYVETVVLLKEDGAFSTVYWNTQAPVGETEAEAPQEQEAPADETPAPAADA
jgi:DNA uptake protein ComE-like DNA-binding protein